MIASDALRIGFLLRGGAAIGRLYHAQGVVFGEALVEAFRIESQTSIYPRVVLSPSITSRPGWIEQQTDIVKDSDGLYHVDYFTGLLPTRLRTGDCKEWLADAIEVVSGNLTALATQGKLKELSKWTWFAHHFRAGLEKTNPELLKKMGIALDVTPWP
jgi:hypothetical protein